MRSWSPSGGTVGSVRVAVASVGDPESRDTWSGITAGILGALRELGVNATGFDLTLPRGVERAVLAAGAAPTMNRYDAHGSALTMRVRSRLAHRRLREARVDGVIQIGTNFTLPGGVPYVTLEDMTLRQGVVIHPVFSHMSERAIEGWEQRRADIYAGARACAVASHWAAESLLVDYNLPHDRVVVVGFGANHDAVPHSQVWHPPRFLFVGVDWERKGGPSLLRAFSRVREVQPDAVLDVVGGHPPLRQSGVNAHGMLSLTRAGARELLAELYARATCLVVPSLVEPFGIVYAEAALAGIPSIVGGQGGAREIIGEHGGAVVDPGDEKGLVEAMLLLTDPNVASRMGVAARERSRLYTWPGVAERLLRALGLRAPDGHALAEFL
jgi:glycosyltransferase involved in cell wall biosynthesis